MQTNIETIYQQHIKPLAHDEQLKLLSKIAGELANGRGETKPDKKRSIMELHGLGAEIWEEIDAFPSNLFKQPCRVSEFGATLWQN